MDSFSKKAYIPFGEKMCEREKEDIMVSRCGMLPYEVIYDILLWLPVVSLLRFKSVCKDWYSLIESSDFITQHLNISNSRVNYKLIISVHPMRNILGDGSFRTTLRFLLLSGNHYQMSETFDFQHRFISLSLRYGLIFSCNSVVLMVHRFHALSYDVCLWNPATKQFRFLPKSAAAFHKYRESPIWSNYGFGFDSKTNDYKVVRIIPENDRKSEIVEVYSLKMDSWRTIDVVLPVHMEIVSSLHTPFHNGIYCWSGWEWGSSNGNGLANNHNIILTFNFTKEEFGTMPVPVDVYRCKKNCSLQVALIRENIGCIECGENWECKIWELNEYGVNDSWMKLYTVVLKSFSYFCCLSMNEMIIWVKRDQLTRELNLCWCNPITEESLQITCNVSFAYGKLIANYKESLVSIN